MYKWKKFLFISMSGLVLGACGGETDADTTPVGTESQSTVVESAESVESKTENTEKESTVGKRSNPASLNEPHTMDVRYYDDKSEGIDGKATITVSDVIRGEEAYSQLVENNEFNEVAPEGYEWAIFNVKMTLEEGSMDDPFNTATVIITPIASDGSEVPQSSYATFSDGTAFGWKDLYEGGTDEGKVGKLIPVGDETLIEISDMNTSVFFKLQ